MDLFFFPLHQSGTAIPGNFHMPAEKDKHTPLPPPLLSLLPSQILRTPFNTKCCPIQKGEMDAPMLGGGVNGHRLCKLGEKTEFASSTPRKKLPQTVLLKAPACQRTPLLIFEGGGACKKRRDAKHFSVEMTPEQEINRMVSKTELFYWGGGHF